MLTIETPSDFERTLGAEAFQIHKLVDPLPEFEAGIRHTIDDIFRDIQYISTDEPQLVSGYLDGVSEPLVSLRSYGLQLACEVVRGRLVLPAGAGPIPLEEEKSVAWSVAHYFVALRPCYYREKGSDSVHMLGVNCEGRMSLVREGAAMRYWGAFAAVEETFDGLVPWCDTCRLQLPD